MAAKGEADEVRHAHTHTHTCPQRHVSNPPAQVPVVPAERDTSDGAAGEEAPERDRSADDVCTKFVVCIVNYSCLVILITVGISFTVGIWTLSEVYEQGAERTFALIEGGPNDRNDLRTLSFEGVRQAQQLNAVKWRMKANDVEDATDPGQILCGEIRRQYRENREGRRLQEGTPAHNDGGGEDGSLLERLDELFSGSGHLPGQTPPVGPLTPEWEALVADRVRQLEPRSVSTTACKRPFSLGCVAHTEAPTCSVGCSRTKVNATAWKRLFSLSSQRSCVGKASAACSTGAAALTSGRTRAP